jgi:hypothetical protein
MAEMSVGTLPFGFVVATDRARPGRLARVVVTGDHGGEGRIPRDPDIPRDAAPEVTLTTDVVDGCRLAGERLAVADAHRVGDRDEQLAEDVLVAASACATL